MSKSHDTGERGLARAVIRAALVDYNKMDDSLAFRSAEQFLFGDGLTYWCEIAGIPKERVKELLDEDKE